jgi:cellulose synthase/poly-beta-1,6-N-acetylglucosamine synthase-like glycosyltransferase
MDLISYLYSFINFWQALEPAQLLRFFWFALFFEFPRYVVFDFVFLTAYHISHFFNKDRHESARNLLFSEHPLVSIVVPGKNEGENIYKLVRSLREQTYKNIEIIIVDDGSDDDTKQICSNLKNNNFIDLYLRSEIRGGKASASNLGLRYSKGKLLLLLDADSSFDRDGIEKTLIPFYMDEKIGAIGGNVKVRNLDDSLCTSLQGIEYLKTISVGRAVASFLGIYRTIPGAFGAFRREVLQRVGGFDVGPGLDGDITVKIRKLGYRIHFEKDAICFTSVPNTFRRLNKQRMRWYKSLVRFRIRKHKDVYFPTENFIFSNFMSFVENIFFNVILDIKWFVYIADIAYNYPAMIKFILPMNYIIYLIFNILQFIAMMSLSERWKNDLKLAVYIPLVPIYAGLYMRIVRTIAYFQEAVYKKSYEDPWNPWKVSKKAMGEGL